VLPSPMNGTADLPPVAEGRDAELASLVNLRSSGSPEPVELPFVHAPTGTMTPRGGRMVRCVARRGCGVFRESGAARRGGAWCRRRQCVAPVGWLIRSRE
jgi:hypothetical protein